MAVRGDRIVLVGSSSRAGDCVDLIRASSTPVGRRCCPAFRIRTATSPNLGASLQVLQLRGTTSYEQIVEMVRARAATARPGEWIQGRSWDQNDWPVKDWPSHQPLTEAAPRTIRSTSRASMAMRRWSTRRPRRAAHHAQRPRTPRAAASFATPRRACRRADRSRAGAGVVEDPAGQRAARGTDPARRCQTRKLGLTMVHDAGPTPATWPPISGSSTPAG